jgi:ABC-type sugar transport system ATPase subunit
MKNSGDVERRSGLRKENAGMPSDGILLDLVQISKQFPGVKALDGVDLSLGKGEVHALVGENGAGKSTLMKILGGIYQPDGGEIRLNGQAVTLPTPHESRAQGIGMVHQEPKLCASLSVAENVLLGNLPRGRLGVSWREARDRAMALLRRVGLAVDPAGLAEDLSIAERQLLQLAKALAVTSRIIILDEPTASLTPVEVDVLFQVVRELQAEGVSFIYISHHLDEIFRIARRVTVLKDGRKVALREVAETSKDELVSLMVGRELGGRFPEKGRTAGATAVEVSGLTGKGFKDVSLTIRRGEVLGIAGLVGAGRTEVARAICGADPVSGGEIRIAGRAVHFRHPADAIARGLAYIAEDRRDGLFMPLSVRENITIAAPEAIATNGILATSRQQKAAEDFIARLNIRTPSAEQPIMYLSGGNQQKCILARWIFKGVDVVVFDEPTRGIDVGAKSEIYRLIDGLVREGKAVVLISSEMPEVLGMADRIVVMSEGRLTGEVSGAEATEENVLALALPTVSAPHEAAA